MISNETIDKIAKLISKAKQEEIDALKSYIESISAEARELANKYSTMTNPDSPIDLFGDAHDLFDFLQGF